MSVTQSVNQAVGQVLQQIIQSLYGNLQSGLQFQTAGQGGSELVYPQGTELVGSDSQYYYPTFSSFNRKVDIVGESDFQVSSSELIPYLGQFYGTLVYGLSSEQYQQLADQQALQNQSINSLFNLMLDDLGIESILWQKAGGLESSWGWPSVQYSVDDYTVPSDQDLPVNSQWIVLSNSISYVCKVASSNSSIALRPAYQQTPWSTLSSQLLNGSINSWDQVFTGDLTSDLENPWDNDLYQKYVTIVRSLNQSSQTVTNQAQQSALVNNASSYLSNYITGNELQLDNTSSQYVEVANASTSGYPSLIPSSSYLYPPNYIQSILSGVGQTISMTAAGVGAAGSDVVAITSPMAQTQQAQASMDDWGFVTQSSKGSASGEVGISSYDPTVSVVTGSFNYTNVGVQIWQPEIQGENAWLLIDPIQEAVSNPTPYIYSSNFEGGFGWTDSASAQTFTQEGLAYISAMAYAGSAVSTLSGSTADSQLWTQDDLDAKGLSTNFGLNFDDWYGSSITASESSAQDVGATLSTTSSNSGSQFLVSSNPMGPISALGPTSSGGLPAIQLARGFQVIVEPNESYEGSSDQNRRFRRASGSGLGESRSGSKNVVEDSLWVSVCKKDSKKKIFLDEQDNILFGSSIEDHAVGSKGDDDLFGHCRGDTLKGGAGSDFISGGVGVNRLHGGAGSDYFEFDALNFSKGFKHKIMDFKPNKDVLWFTKGWYPTRITVKSNLLRFAGKTIGILEGLQESEVIEALEDAVFI